MNILPFYTLYLISFLIFLYKRSKIMMHFFQQEEYDGCRFIKYISRKLKFIDKRLSGIILLSAFTLFLTKDFRIHISLISALLLISAFLHPNPCKKAKKVLVITQRVRRILTVFYTIFFIILSGFFYTFCYCGGVTKFYPATIILIQLIPFVIVLANICLKPLEKKVRNKFLNEAKEKMAELNPIVIGITGSYGKTSVRHILEHIMSSVVPTLATPGSVNTEMGITRVIREKLKPEHKYFIVEMGAYAPGAIANRCELAPPTYGILTVIGNAHYERFKNEANVAKTKFELAQAVFKNKEGKMIINVDAVKKKYIDKYCKKNEDKVIRVSASKGKKGYVVSDEKFTKDGVEFKIKVGKKSYKIKSPLYGEHQVSNIAVCFALAHSIGIPAESIVASLKSVKPMRHRLEVKKMPDGHILIDDAYNSNPTGFKSALSTLKLLKKKGGRTILVTPGMAELGELHDKKHTEIGKIAGEFVDVLIAVVPKRIKTFIDGFKQNSSSSQKVLEFDTFSKATEWLNSNIESNDVVLYENDLPDLYETKLKI